MRLRKLIQELPEANVFGPVNRDVRGIASQARRVGVDTLYVALPEANRDTWADADCAVNRGASAVVCETESLVTRRVARIQVPDVREALARAAVSYYGRPSARMFLVGVAAGEHGKVIASLLHAMMQAAGQKTGLITSVQHIAGDRPFPMWTSRPQSHDIQQSLSHMARAGCATCVVEVAPDEAAWQQYLGTEFDLWVRADLTPPRSVSGSSPIAGSRSQPGPRNFKEWDKSKAAVIDIDAVFGSRFSREWTPAVQLTDGTPVPFLLRAGQLQLGLHGSRFVVSLPERCYDCCLPSLYLEDVYNALASVQAARIMGLAGADIVAGMRQYRGVPGRLEAVRAGQPFQVFVDGARTPETLRVALHTLKRVCAGRLHLLLGHPGGKPSAVRHELGRLAAHVADKTVVTSDNPGSESAAAIAAALAAGYESRRCDGLEIILDRDRALRRILSNARPGDCVLVAGKGHVAFQELADTIVPFDDRDRARVVLESLGYSRE